MNYSLAAAKATARPIGWGLSEQTVVAGPPTAGIMAGMFGPLTKKMPNRSRKSEDSIIRLDFISPNPTSWEEHS
jgi:hypothetical protein